MICARARAPLFSRRKMSFRCQALWRFWIEDEGRNNHASARGSSPRSVLRSRARIKIPVAGAISWFEAWSPLQSGARIPIHARTYVRMAGINCARDPGAGSERTNLSISIFLHGVSVGTFSLYLSLSSLPFSLFSLPFSLSLLSLLSGDACGAPLNRGTSHEIHAIRPLHWRNWLSNSERFMRWRAFSLYTRFDVS